MVTLKALDRKLLRDLWSLKTQVVSIALVIACGIGGFIGTFSTYGSLLRSRDDYYATARFPHVFATAKRAPQALLERIREHSGRGGSRGARGARGAAFHSGRGAADDRAPHRPGLRASGGHEPPDAEERPLAGAGRARRGGGEPALPPGAPSQARRHDERAAQRQARARDAGRHRAQSRVHLRHARRRHAGRRMVRGAVDRRARARRGVQHGRRVQLGAAAPFAAGIRRARDRGAGRHPRALRQPRRGGPRGPDLAQDHHAGDQPAAHLRHRAAGDLPAGGGVHPERGAPPPGARAARRDRGAQGARLRRPLDRVALPQVRLGHRPPRNT